MVQGDSVKIQRIVQNLLLNALKYTEQGGVKVSWGEVAPKTYERWVLCVQDTGPGFQDGPVTPLAHALKKSTEEVQEVEHKAKEAGQNSTFVARAPTLASESIERPEDDS